MTEHTQTERDRQTDRQRPTETETETETDRDRQTGTHTHTPHAGRSIRLNSSHQHGGGQQDGVTLAGDSISLHRGSTLPVN